MAIDHFEGPHITAEAARAEAERLRRAADEARELGEEQREAAETLRHAREQQREAAEAVRTVAEEGRAAAESIRHDTMIEVRATAESLHLTLEHMNAVEALRRALRGNPEPIIPDKN